MCPSPGCRSGPAWRSARGRSPTRRSCPCRTWISRRSSWSSRFCARCWWLSCRAWYCRGSPAPWSRWLCPEQKWPRQVIASAGLWGWCGRWPLSASGLPRCASPWRPRFDRTRSARREPAPKSPRFQEWRKWRWLSWLPPRPEPAWHPPCCSGCCRWRSRWTARAPAKPRRTCSSSSGCQSPWCRCRR